MSVNRVILLGNVTKDPAVKTFDDGGKIATFAMAMNERGYTAKNGTVIPERVEYANIVCSRGLAQIAEQYVKKGNPLYVEGKLRTRSYGEGNDKRYITEVYAENIELLGGRKEQAAQPTTQQAVQHQPQGYYDQKPQPPQDEIDNLPF